MGNCVNKDINETTGECSVQDLYPDKFYVTIDLVHRVEIRKLSWTGYRSGKCTNHSKSGASYNRRNLADLKGLQEQLEKVPATVMGQPETLAYVKQQVQACLVLP
jgi:hypothetical protein